MDFTLTENQLLIQSAARDFAAKEIAPVAAQFDLSGDFPRDNVRKAGELGFMGV
jgi:alkylation response protein AidB-like acyl-CoA dehydrogenase